MDIVKIYYERILFKVFLDTCLIFAPVETEGEFLRPVRI